MTDTSTYAGTPLVEVALPSGAMFEAMTEDEAQLIEARTGLYMEQFAFESISDLIDLDRVVSFEMRLHRYNLWLGRGRNYENRSVNEPDLEKRVKDLSFELARWKKLLGIDKTTRDKTTGKGSVHEYIMFVRTAAEQFGIHREHQLDKALELTQQLIYLAGLYERCTDRERRQQHCTSEDVMEWVNTVFLPEMAALDAHFREHVQQYWVRDL